RKELAVPIVGSDIRGDAISFSETNARAAGVGHLLPFEVKDVANFRPPNGPPGVIVCNPPYGERIGEEKELRSLYRTLGEVFAQCPGWRAFVFTGNGSLARQIKLPVAERLHLFNGKIACQLLRYDIPDR